jgi:hypothetical protein
MLGPQPARDPFTDAAAVPPTAYPYAQSYPQNTASNAANPPAASYSNVTLGPYSQDAYAHMVSRPFSGTGRSNCPLRSP